MIKKIWIFFFCSILNIFIIASVNSNIKISKDSITNATIIYNWVISKNKDNPDEIKKILNIIGDVNFEKLNSLGNKSFMKDKFYRPFYKPFYNYNKHTTKTIENIFKAREIAADKNEFDELIFDLYKKDDVKPLIDKITSSNSQYKSLFNNILKSENEAYLVYDWGTTSKRNDFNETKKVLDIIGNVDFTKVSDIEQRNNNKVNYNFYTYPYHNFQTIKSMFDAKAYGASAVQLDNNIYLLYQKNDLKLVIDKVTNSNPKYGKHFNIIKEEFTPRNKKQDYQVRLLSYFVIGIGAIAIILSIINIDYLSSSSLKNKIITNKKKYLKYNKLKLAMSGIILILLGIAGLYTSNLENYNVLLPLLGFVVLLINANFFEHKSEKYVKNK